MSKEFKDVVLKAFDAAHTATQKVLSAPDFDWYPCGFASVRIKPATSKFAKYLKAEGLAKKAYGGGLLVWNPSRSGTQSLDAKGAGCAAFVSVLKAELGIDCWVESRMD
jgi:hypothetical protein